jgi:sugar-specific transcriptional regulator TrmB
MIEPRSLLAKLGLSDAEADVYLAMLNGAQSARDIINATNRARPTVYYSLTALERRGLLSKTGLEDAQRFRVEPLKRLVTMVDEQQAEVAAAKEGIEQFITQFDQRRKGDDKPNVSFYEGSAAVRNVIMESIYTHSRRIDSLIPAENFFWQLGPEFVTKYVEARWKLSVKTRHLWATKVDKSTIDKYYEHAAIRMLPDKLGSRFKTSVFMYDDNVLYVSSLASGYALVVHSAEHFELMQMLYEGLWAQSTPLKS